MRAHVTTDFERVEIPGAGIYEDNCIFRCPNCLTECSQYDGEERGRASHTITECFEVMMRIVSQLEMARGKDVMEHSKLARRVHELEQLVRPVPYPAAIPRPGAPS